MTPLSYLNLILSRKPILIPAVIKVSTCVMTHVLCLISEISCDRVSLLVVCVLLLSSEQFSTAVCILFSICYFLLNGMCE